MHVSFTLSFLSLAPPLSPIALCIIIIINIAENKKKKGNTYLYYCAEFITPRVFHLSAFHYCIIEHTASVYILGTTGSTEDLRILIVVCILTYCSYNY